MRRLLFLLLALCGCRSETTHAPPSAKPVASSAPTAASAAAPASKPTPPRRYRAGEIELQVRLVPEQTRVMLGEPLIVRFEIENLSDRELTLEQGGNANWQLGRDYLYELNARGPDGKPLSVRPPRARFSGLTGPLTIGARARFAKPLVVQQWVRFERLGRHRLHVKQEIKPLGSAAIASEADAEVEVIPATADGIGKVIDRLGVQLLAADEERARFAARALSYVDDPRAATPFDRALASTRVAVRVAAVEGVAALSSPRALPVLSRALENPELSVRRAAARALERRKEPEAAAALAALSRDPDAEIRLVVVRSLAERRDDTAGVLLKQLARDKDPRVSREAQSALAGFSAAIRQNP